jgi:transcriptional regulator with XRE-family HTH domain
MFSTPHTAQLLLRIMALQDWSQADFAARAGVHRATVNQHLNGNRTIRDEHIIGYLQAVPTPDIGPLAAAWLRDLLHAHPHLLDGIITPNTETITDSVATWSPTLTPAQTAALDFWGANLPTDPELSQLFELLTRRAQGTSPDFPA